MFSPTFNIISLQLDFKYYTYITFLFLSKEKHSWKKIPTWLKILTLTLTKRVTITSLVSISIAQFVFTIKFICTPLLFVSPACFNVICQIVLRTLVIHKRFILGKTVFVHVDVGQIYNQTFLIMNMRITVNSRNKGKDKCHSLKYCYITETERLHLMKSAQWLNMNLRIHCSIN